MANYGSYVTHNKIWRLKLVAIEVFLVLKSVCVENGQPLVAETVIDVDVSLGVRITQTN